MQFLAGGRGAGDGPRGRRPEGRGGGRGSAARTRVPAGEPEAVYRPPSGASNGAPGHRPQYQWVSPRVRLGSCRPGPRGRTIVPVPVRGLGEDPGPAETEEGRRPSGRRDPPAPASHTTLDQGPVTLAPGSRTASAAAATSGVSPVRPKWSCAGECPPDGRPGPGPQPVHIHTRRSPGGDDRAGIPPGNASRTSWRASCVPCPPGATRATSSVGDERACSPIRARRSCSAPACWWSRRSRARRGRRSTLGSGPGPCSRAPPAASSCGCSTACWVRCGSCAWPAAGRSRSTCRSSAPP